MSGNVIILGAGFSFDAGIPLLSGFVDQMWECSVRGSMDGTKLNEPDTEIFKQAMMVRETLDGYHGRATFNDRNIEDILSLLSFIDLSGSREGKQQLHAMTRAIARTIELSCSVKHPGIRSDGAAYSITEGPLIYRSFWIALFERFIRCQDFPTIITFNYDLVLERSLLQTLIGTNYPEGEQPLNLRNIILDYKFPHVPRELWQTGYADFTDGQFKRTPGRVLTKSSAVASDSILSIELLKLHGSLNFPSSPNKNGSAYNVAESLEQPFILPPIFNKLTSDTPGEMWKTALQRLNQAHNVVFVGYSLPPTDIYMQYFLKAGLGPNRNLNRIHVIDPCLGGDIAGRDLRHRYESCFSPQLKSRISFHSDDADWFVNHLDDDSTGLLF